MQGRVSKAVSVIRPSVIREMALKAAKLDKVISLGIGEPDFNTPSGICREALLDALRGATRYTASQGDPELLEALLAYTKHHFGCDLSRENIVITGGGIGALTAFFRTVLNPGDEVLVPEPHFPAYRPQIEWAGGRLVQVPTSFEQGFTLTVESLERSITRRTKVLLINYPNNPTGAVISGTMLDNLARLASERDLLVVSDEVYYRFLFDGVSHESIATRPDMLDRTVVIASFSKSFAMTGWRVGYAFGPEWIIKEMIKVLAYYTSCASSVSQRAALAALKQDPSVCEAMVEEFRLRRDLIYHELGSLAPISVHKPAGSFYIFPDLRDVTSDTEKFALDLLAQERVVVIPGSAFGPSGAGCVRMAFTVDRSLLAEALKRFSRFVEERTEN